MAIKRIHNGLGTWYFAVCQCCGAKLSIPPPTNPRNTFNKFRQMVIWLADQGWLNANTCPTCLIMLDMSPVPDFETFEEAHKRWARRGV